MTAAAAVLLAFAVPRPAYAAGDRLTGGSEFALTVDAERLTSDGTTRVWGTARLGAPTMSRARTVIYVLDLSSSTNEPAGGDCGADQDATDPQSVEDEIVDCQIAAAKRLNVALGETAQHVAVVGFAGDAVSADLSPSPRWAMFGDPARDADHDRVLDVDEVLSSLRVPEEDDSDGGFFGFQPSRLRDPSSTNFSAAIDEALRVAESAPTQTVTVFLLSDGEATGGRPVVDALSDARGVTFHTFAVGAGSRCDGDREGYGSLGDIARRTGGTCTRVRDSAALPSTLAQFAGSVLTGLTLSADARDARTVRRSALSRALPTRGPATVRFADAVKRVRSRVCVTARATDTGGNGELTQCARVVPAGAVAAGGQGHGAAARRTAGGGSARLRIPAIGVDARVQALSLQRDRTLAVPQDARTVGSYVATPGPRVLVGHVDWNGHPGVFSGLRELRRGDHVELRGPARAARRYVVTRIEQRPKSRFPTRRVYRGSSSALRLITCAGAFDPHRRAYTENLIVYAERVPS